MESDLEQTSCSIGSGFAHPTDLSTASEWAVDSFCAERRRADRYLTIPSACDLYQKCRGFPKPRSAQNFAPATHQRSKPYTKVDDCVGGRRTEDRQTKAVKEVRHDHLERSSPFSSSKLTYS